MEVLDQWSCWSGDAELVTTQRGEAAFRGGHMQTATVTWNWPLELVLVILVIERVNTNDKISEVVVASLVSILSTGTCFQIVQGNHLIQ